MRTQTHDLCSPSKLKLRWQCPGSPALEMSRKTYGRKGSRRPTDAQRRGTALHEAALKWLADGSPSRKAVFNGHRLTADDQTAVSIAVGHVTQRIAMMTGPVVSMYEVPMDLAAMGIQTLDGCRADVVAVCEDEVVVFELKFGAMEVDDPQYNWQVKAYGIGARLAGRRTTAVIVQPDADVQAKEYTFTNEELDVAIKEIGQIVAATKQPNAPLNRGPHCSMCDAREFCPAWKELILGIPKLTTVSTYMARISPAARRAYYENLCEAAKWFNATVKKSEQFIMDGGKVDGYSVGPGRGSRQWKNDGAALIALHDYAAENGMIGMKFSEVVSPSQAEKLLGTGSKSVISELTVRAEGKPTVVQEK